MCPESRMCPECGRPKVPVDRCSPDSIHDDGECPYLTISRLRAELARPVSPAPAAVPGDMKTMDDCPFSAQIDQHRFASAVLDEHLKREFVPAGDYVPLDTRFGAVRVLPVDGEHANVEVRDHYFLIDGVHFCFALCVQVVAGRKAALVGSLTEWSSGGTLTPRRRELLLQEVLARVDAAASGPMAPAFAAAFAAARKRVLSNSILSCEEDVEEAREKLADLEAVLASLVDEERGLP